jgi:fibro-slime domain-containing protein
MPRSVPARALLLLGVGLLPSVLLGCASEAVDSAPIGEDANGAGGSALLPGGGIGTGGGTVLTQDAGPDDAKDSCVLADGTRCVYQVADAGPTCGDGHVDLEIGEVCDDGNTLAGDGCAGTCKLIEPNSSCPPEGGPCTSTVQCGNGVRDTGESCDDGNTAAGDGCVANCRAVEAGYFCPTAGQPCQQLQNCGDGHITTGELCDDGNTAGGDGCSEACQVEEGWRCSARTGCARIARCGDGVVADSEGCDDGNEIPLDGCSAQCRVEGSWWSCPTPGQPCVDNAVCGNGVLEKEEVCDDGDTDGGDGCSPTCTLEDGWQCRVPGRDCVPLCGDSNIVPGKEQCDDGNATSGDGCSSTCIEEPGWDCGTAVPSVCTQSVCGNGVVEQGESCDAGDENGLFYGDAANPGCSKTCTLEPSCRTGTQTHACTTTCGDGNIDDGEACDDGNQVPGDGCSTTCTVEDGFLCTDVEQPDTEPCELASGDCLILPVIIRDFEGQNVTGGHPDFFFLGKTGIDGAVTRCVPNASGVKATRGADGHCPANDQAGPCEGLVADTLDAEGKPVMTKNVCACVFTDWDMTGLLGTCAGGDAECVPAAGATGVQDCWTEGNDSHRLMIDLNVKVIESADTFQQWYRDTPGVNTSVRGTLELESVGGSLYQFSSSDGLTVQDDVHDACSTTTTAGTLSSGFFPVEDAGGTKLCNIWPYWILSSSDDCCAGPGCPVASQWDPTIDYGSCTAGGDGGPVPPNGQGEITGMERNFYFTTEARYLFRYDAAAPPTLSFYGDDDVWVFVNGQLALDLGAPHERLEGSVRVSQDFGLEDGKIYEIVVFHADRHPRESNYQLTLSGFTTLRSQCQPRCGDGQMTAGEECDLGEVLNDDTTYNGCTTECKFGPFCGDGVVNGAESCDDGRNVTVGYNLSGCAPGCVWPPSCGNAQLDPGEECDEGAANADGVYGGCSTSCTLNAYCGDGVVNGSEQCDDGVNTGGYGYCDVGCVLGPRCGDGIVQDVEGGETCDEGELNGLPGSTCTENCGVPGYCGDAIVQPELGEECDLGANTGEYGGCAQDCLLGPYCGDGVVQPEGNEACDFGALNSPLNAAEYGGCLISCQLGPHCGDGNVEEGHEQCDDGGNEDQDGCSATCLIEIAVPR